MEVVSVQVWHGTRQGEGHKKRWGTLGKVRRERREVWGISPEVEFLLCQGLGIQVQHWASPFTALKGGWGREMVVGSFEHPEDGGARPPQDEERSFVVAYPGKHAEEPMTPNLKRIPLCNL